MVHDLASNGQRPHRSSCSSLRASGRSALRPEWSVMTYSLLLRRNLNLDSRKEPRRGEDILGLS
jgi:hypothetical protein